jgi:hypothetical protein
MMIACDDCEYQEPKQGGYCYMFAVKPAKCHAGKLRQDRPDTCPECKSQCWREKVDVGAGKVYGPWQCNICGWIEWRYEDIENHLDTTASMKGI